MFIFDATAAQVAVNGVSAFVRETMFKNPACISRKSIFWKQRVKECVSAQHRGKEALKSSYHLEITKSL
jgi:hypothetical protein